MTFYITTVVTVTFLRFGVCIVVHSWLLIRKISRKGNDVLPGQRTNSVSHWIWEIYLKSTYTLSLNGPVNMLTKNDSKFKGVNWVLVLYIVYDKISVA